MRISIVAAMDRNRLIGQNNRLPWHLPSDLQHFKRLTLGKPVLMGRKTFESIGRPLPDRTNIVLSRNSAFNAKGVRSVTTLCQAFVCAASEDEIMVIGGGELYRLTLPLADRMYITDVDVECEGDAWFPDYDKAGWREINRQTVEVDDRNLHRHHFLTLEKAQDKG